jgi:hypothetical protein
LPSSHSAWRPFGAFHEERHVDYVIAFVCLMPLAALIAISLSAS